MTQTQNQGGPQGGGQQGGGQQNPGQQQQKPDRVDSRAVDRAASRTPDRVANRIQDRAADNANPDNSEPRPRAGALVYSEVV
jgi:hypothetical protein